MSLKQRFYIWRNKNHLFETNMVFPSNGILNYPLFLFLDKSNIWKTIGYAVLLLKKYNGHILLDEEFIPFWIFLGGDKSVIMKDADDTINSIYVSFSNNLTNKEKYIITKLKSKYRYSFKWYEYPYTNIVPIKNGLEYVFNIRLQQIDWNKVLSDRNTEQSIFVEKQNKKTTSFVENFSGKVYFTGVYWKGVKKVTYVHSQNMVKSLIISKKRFLSSKYLISFCEYFGLEYEKI